VGFAPLLRIENKELKGFRLSHDPPDPLESFGRDSIEHVATTPAEARKTLALNTQTLPRRTDAKPSAQRFRELPL
jgi:hypothetical protein